MLKYFFVAISEKWMDVLDLLPKQCRIAGNLPAGLPNISGSLSNPSPALSSLYS